MRKKKKMVIDEGWRKVVRPNDRVALVGTNWYADIVDQLIGTAKDALLEVGVKEDQIEVFRVAGCFELCGAAANLVEEGTFAAVIPLGVLIRGETSHFDFLSQAVLRSLCEISSQADVAVSSGVLTCNTHAEASARIDAGKDAALAALSLLAVYRSQRKD